MEVRTARPEEYDAVGELTARVYVEEGYTAADSPYVPQLRDAGRRAREAELLVAVDDDGTLLGSVTFAPPGSAYGEIVNGVDAAFRMLVVDQAARRRGVGEALARACVARAANLGSPRVLLSSQRDMVSAHRLYQRLGFVRTPGRDWSPLPGVDLVTYELSLR